MKAHFLPILCCLILSLSANAQIVKVLFTSDVHGALFPYNYVDNTHSENSMAKVSTFVDSVRAANKHVILLDGGDVLQGSPSVYYYNFIDTISTHIIPHIYNYLKYDALCIGNHDIETGHKVYDRVIRQLKSPVLGANAVKSDGTPYFKPYTIINKGGKRIAIIGLITPHIPHWLTENLWSGMAFEDMVVSAAHWMKVVRETEHPDYVIGLFHSGFDYTYGGVNIDTYKNENASQIVAMRVAGFDLILCGHDHQLHNEKVTDPNGNIVPILDSGTGAKNIGQVTITFNGTARPETKVELASVVNKRESDRYLLEFKKEQTEINHYAKTIVGHLENDIVTHESLFGPSELSDIVHNTMLKHTGATISITAPLLINVTIPKGELSIGGMFNIYRYENILTAMSLTGKEIKDYLEYSYDLWISNPDSTGHLLLLTKRKRLASRYYNLDAAAGIRYTVNPYEKKGNRVNISTLEDGTPFDLDKTYTVAVNSYRANGGGGHLERGLGIPHDKIKERITKVIESDIRGLIINDFLEQKGKINIKHHDNWKFVPEENVEPYLNADKKLFE